MKILLPPGAKIIRSIIDEPNGTGGLVLCKWESGASTHVTWRVDMRGNTYQGHYFSSEKAALADFRERDAKIWGS